jgi:hypothetical protein
MIGGWAGRRKRAVLSAQSAPSQRETARGRTGGAGGRGAGGCGAGRVRGAADGGDDAGDAVLDLLLLDDPPEEGADPAGLPDFGLLAVYSP